MELAQDLDDARLLFAHQQRVSGLTNPMERALANAEFAQTRQTRRAATTP